MEALKVMKEAWKAYTANVARLISGTAVMLVALIGLAIFSLLPSLALFIFQGHAAALFFLSITCLFVLISIGLAGLLTYGYIKFVSQAFGPDLEKAKKGKIHSDERPDIMLILNSLSSGKEMALAFYSYAAAFFLIFAVPYFYTGSIESFIFSLPFALMFCFFTGFAPCFVVFENDRYLSAFGKSFEFAVNHFWGWLALLFVLGIIALVLAILPVLGPVILFALVPWFVLSKVCFHQKA